jgi:hypothetical protein
MLLSRMNTLAPADIPNGHFELRSDARHPHWVILTAYHVGSEEPMMVEMTLDQWIVLAPVLYVIQLELSQRQPRRPSGVTRDSASVLPVPRGHIEWKDGRNWVVLTAYRAGTQNAVTVKMTLGHWFALKPVRAAVMDRFENWQDRKMPKW